GKDLPCGFQLLIFVAEDHNYRTAPPQRIFVEEDLILGKPGGVCSFEFLARSRSDRGTPYAQKTGSCQSGGNYGSNAGNNKLAIAEPAESPPAAPIAPPTRAP